MTNPEQPASTAQPARAAGYALLGLAAIALVIGVISLFGGSDDEPPAAQPPPPSATAPDSQAPSPNPESPTTGSSTSGSPATSAPAPTTEPSAPAPTTAPPTTGAPAGQATDPPPPPVVARPPVRVYNNGTISGLAARVSNDVRGAGWEVAETANYSQGLIPTTTVYYRPGTDEETSARLLADVLQARLEPRFDGIEDAHPGIIVIATNDYQGSSGKTS
ncbi:LytR C-terminal domain-containing protein [Saccharothrix xinjiangensis]|uniref:LytR C-terminal domain-containing protein n=1 Tax=Saccharothrix xinjiangensis TaxID=204798 RepID=A0ABV9XWC8_9PSEU